MSPQITRVRWSASSIPWGLKFNEQTGTFSGVPEDVGEYSVPVTVETNWGKDTKHVIIKVNKAYPVYAVGNMAETWSENAEADENGFRKLNMPNAIKLLNHYNGFGAKVSGGDYYCCGVYDIRQNFQTPNPLLNASTPYNMGNIDECRVIKFYNYGVNISTADLSKITQYSYVMFVKSANSFSMISSLLYTYFD